jgi:hypothetical protein
MHKSDNTDQYAGLTIHSTQPAVAASREYGNEPSAFMKSGEFRNYVGDDELLKNDSAQWSSYYSLNTSMETTEIP